MERTYTTVESAAPPPIASPEPAVAGEVAPEAPPPVPVSLPEGEKIGGRFAVRHVARRGGMGTIHAGTDLETGQPVAIKIIGVPSGSSGARFAREARILSELSHPGIVRYLAHGANADGILYLVMEWLEGQDLADRLSAGRLTVEDSFALVRRVAEALEVAHLRGIVHRDIKPANLFLGHGDPRDVRVLDFGIARFSVPEPTLTQNNSLIGTVGYMSPEQAMCEADIDARADVFSIGCVLYQCLTGRAPFASAHPVGVLAKVLREEPLKASELCPDLDPRIDGLLSKLLAKRREDRLPGGAAICEYLDALARPEVRPPSWSQRRTTQPGQSGEQRIISVILGRSTREHRGEVRIGDELSAELTSKFGAEIAPLKGGAVLLVLTGLAEANDRAVQAARCALFFQENQPDLVLSVATGLAETAGRVPVGAAIDRAAAQLANYREKTPHVLLDDATVGLIGPRFDVQRIGGAAVLVGVRREFEAPRVLMGRPTPHVGRTRELDMLNGVLDECISSGVARTVLVTGPPGIGKTRFASEWLEGTRSTGSARVLFARSDPGAAGSPLSVMQQLVRDASGLREAEPAMAQLAHLEEYLAHLLSEQMDAHEPCASFLSEIVGLGNVREAGAMVRMARANPDMMREQTRRAVHRWMSAEVKKRPVIVVLDDLHWADPSSVALLVELVQKNPELPLMLVALARPEAEKLFPELREQATVCVRLPRLTARAAQQLVDAVLTDVPERGQNAAVVARIIRTADGNPFYLEELIRRVASGSTEWPDTVLAMAQSRIEQLDVVERRVLRAASIFGERCWDHGIAEVVGGDVDVRALLPQLEQSELLTRVPESRFPSAREYRFRHALFRDAAYAMMTGDDRRTSHGIAGDWLERHLEKDPAVLADHYEAAAMHERACACLVKATKAAVDVGDIASAAQFASRGVRLGAEGAERGTLLLWQSYSGSLSGRPNLDASREALRLLSEGTASWWLGLAVFVFDASVCGQPAEAIPYLDRAKTAPCPAQPDLALAQGLLTLVAGCVLMGKAETAGAILSRAERSPALSERDAVLDAFIATARCGLASMAPIDGQWRLESAFHGGRRCAEALGRYGATDGECTALNYFAVAAMHLGFYEEARDASRRALEASQRTSFRNTEEWARLFMAKAHLRLGEVQQALAAVEPLGGSVDWNVGQMLPVIVGEARLVQGDFAGAEEAVSGAFSGQSPRLQRLAACVLAKSQLKQGDGVRALETIERTLATRTSNGLESDIDLLTLRAEARFACGDATGARVAIAEARALIDRIAAGIDDALLQTSFVTRVEPCARAIGLCDAWAVPPRETV